MPIQSTATLKLAQDQMFQFPDGCYRFSRELGGSVYLMQKVDTGLERPIPEADLIQLLSQGIVTRVKPFDFRSGNKARNLDVLAPAEEKSARGLRAKALQFYVKRFDQDGTIPVGRKAIGEFIARTRPVARQAGLNFPVKVRPLMRAIVDCGESGDRPIRCFLSQKGRGRRPRLPREIEKLLDKASVFYWSKRSRDYSDAFAFFRAELKAINQQRKENGEKILDPPKRMETLRTRINLASSHATWSQKYSKFEADRKFNGIAESLKATRPGELVIIDHTVMDNWVLVDFESGLPLGRLTLTIAIDVATRCILGFLVSAEPPSLYSVMTILKRINQDKSYIKDLYPDIEGVWDSWCHPSCLLLDNGWEFTSPSTQDALADLGVEVIWSPIATPAYKAIGERIFHTFNTRLIHKLPGAVPYDPRTMGKLRLDPKATNFATVDDIEHIMHMVVVSYENERHEGMGGIPARVWQEKIAIHGRPFIDDINLLNAAAGTVTSAVLTRAGIRFKNMNFHDKEGTTRLLNDMFRLEAKRTQSDKPLSSGRVQVKIKYNPADASQIQVWNHGASNKDYVTLYNRDQRYAAGLSFWAAARVYAFAKEKDAAFQTDEQKWLVRNQMRELAESFLPELAHGKSRQARRLLAQQRPTLEGRRVVETEAEGKANGWGEAEMIPIDVLAEERLDAEAIPAGVPLNAAKQKITRKRRKALKAATVAAIDALRRNDQTMSTPAPSVP